MSNSVLSAALRDLSLQQRLSTLKKTAWLDVGCGGTFEEGFDYIDTFPSGMIDARYRTRYRRLDILNAPFALLASLPKYDLVRMQHVLEHFSYEEGLRVLERCAVLLKTDGMLLVTTPDLRVHVEKYRVGAYRSWRGFRQWANARVPKDAPDSFYFSVFAPALEHEPHKWCYDFPGLQYLFRASGRFRPIREILLSDPLASIPFTHNRPEEDVCIMALKTADGKPCDRTAAR